MGRDGAEWGGIGWDGVGWNGMGWDGVGWGGMRWERVGRGGVRQGHVIRDPFSQSRSQTGIHSWAGGGWVEEARIGIPRQQRMAQQAGMVMQPQPGMMMQPQPGVMVQPQPQQGMMMQSQPAVMMQPAMTMQPQQGMMMQPQPGMMVQPQPGMMMHPNSSMVMQSQQSMMPDTAHVPYMQQCMSPGIKLGMQISGVACSIFLFFDAFAKFASFAGLCRALPSLAEPCQALPSSSGPCRCRRQTRIDPGDGLSRGGVRDSRAALVKAAQQRREVVLKLPADHRKHGPGAIDEALDLDGCRSGRFVRQRDGSFATACVYLHREEVRVTAMRFRVQQ